MRRPAFASLLVAASLAAAGAKAPENDHLTDRLTDRQTETVMAAEPVARDVEDVDLGAVAAAILLSLEWSMR
jgi:hypothetical protein